MDAFGIGIIVDWGERRPRPGSIIGYPSSRVIENETHDRAVRFESWVGRSRLCGSAKSNARVWIGSHPRLLLFLTTKPASRTRNSWADIHDSDCSNCWPAKTLPKASAGQQPSWGSHRIAPQAERAQNPRPLRRATSCSERTTMSSGQK